VLVRLALEALAVAARHQQDRDASRFERAAQRRGVAVEHHVDHGGVVVVVAELCGGGVDGRRGVDRAHRSQRRGEHHGDGAVVIHHEHSRGVSVRHGAEGTPKQEIRGEVSSAGA
jgi:hypothetical protein